VLGRIRSDEWLGIKPCSSLPLSERWVMTCGAGLSEREGKASVPLRVCAVLGRGPDLGLGRNGAPASLIFLFFSFSVSYFLICFIIFAK
jgi:hypothetical protein